MTRSAIFFTSTLVQLLPHVQYPGEGRRATDAALTIIEAGVPTAPTTLEAYIFPARSGVTGFGSQACWWSLVIPCALPAIGDRL